MFQVGEVSRLLKLNPQTLYFYERIGLIPSPQRTVAGYRLYSQEDIERIAFITRAKFLGLSLDEIKDILVLKDAGGFHFPKCDRYIQKKSSNFPAKFSLIFIR